MLGRCFHILLLAASLTFPLRHLQNLGVLIPHPSPKLLSGKDLLQMIYGSARIEGRLILHFKPWLNYKVKGIVSYQRNSRNQDVETPEPSADRKPVRAKEYLNSSPGYVIDLSFGQVVSPLLASASLSVVTKSCYTYVTGLLLRFMKPST